MKYKIKVDTTNYNESTIKAIKTFNNNTSDERQILLTFDDNYRSILSSKAVNTTMTLDDNSLTINGTVIGVSMGTESSYIFNYQNATITSCLLTYKE